MTEYFTTSELAYARLAILHGFEGCESHWLGTSDAATWHNGFNPFASAWRFPKTPHNVGLMEIRERDAIAVMKHEFNGMPYLASVCEEDNDSHKLMVFSNHDWQSRIGEPSESLKQYIEGWRDCHNARTVIIYRTINGKPTPFPVWDEERV